MTEPDSRTLPTEQGRSFDRAHSLRLDGIILKLEQAHSPWWRRWYRLRKRIAELNVPVWYPEARP